MNINSTQELNEAAAKLRDDGDAKGLYDLAEKYGIEKEDAEDYLDGAETLATPLILALSAAERGRKELNAEGVIGDWIGVLESMAAESEELAEMIAFSGKSIKGLLGKILKQAFESKVKINDDIAEAAGIRTPLYLGIPGNADLKNMICKYYGVTI